MAFRHDELFHLFAAALNHAQYLIAELDHQKDQAGFKRNSEVAPVGVGGGSLVEAQFADHSTPTRVYRSDPVVKKFQEILRSWLSRLGKEVYDEERDLIEIGYPHRSVPEQWRAG